ncbi:hypothetical protein DP117_15825 [Brasilonema sp. UFV-L1]|uniref:hypothetical protein n=1 Tax=Brasilonema sp. UFV-L1 TaxID=2234130 RepID=UPI0016A64DBC|nr:hypothetical protein [Brasilonema sp. UFV-L1]
MPTPKLCRQKSKGLTVWFLELALCHLQSLQYAAYNPIIPIQNSKFKIQNKESRDETWVWECVSVAFFFQIGISDKTDILQHS